MSWRTLLAAVFAAPSLPIHREIEDAVRRRREASSFTARVHRAAQVSALDIIGDGRPVPAPLDAIEAMLRGERPD